MYRNLALPALLTLSLCACSTQTEPVKPKISDEIRAACEPLPKLHAEIGQDMRQALLQNRSESELVHKACAARHRGALRAVGVEPLTTKPPDRWAEFNRLLKETPPKGTP